MGSVRAGGVTHVVMLVLAAALVTAGAGCSSCRKEAGSDGEGESTHAEGGSASNQAPSPASSRAGSAEDEELDAGGGDPLVEAGNRFRDAQPRADTDPSEGPVDPACIGGKGGELSFATAVVDERCAIGRVRAKKLRAALEQDGGPPAPLRQEGKVLDDGRVAVRLVNTGPVPLSLPLIFSSALPAFLVMAEDEGQTLYELAAPRFDVAASGAGARTRAHFARIVLEPGGAATATLTIDPAIASVVARRGGDRADAGASKLAKGHYVLRVGELLTDVEAGAPARVPFDVR
jgi:hypothetical protein